MEGLNEKMRSLQQELADNIEKTRIAEEARSALENEANTAKEEANKLLQQVQDAQSTIAAMKAEHEKALNDINEQRTSERDVSERRVDEALEAISCRKGCRD